MKRIKIRLDDDETTDENDNGDEIILKKKPREKENSQSRGDQSAKERNDNDDGADEVVEDDSNGDDAVEDVTRQVQKERSPKAQKETVELLSDGDDDSDADDSDGSIAEGSDAWEDDEDPELPASSPDDDSDDSDFDEDQALVDDDGDSLDCVDEDLKPVARKGVHAKNCKQPPESPLQVKIEAKDVPLAPGKREGKEDDSKSPGPRDGDDGMEAASMLVGGAAGKGRADQAVKDRIIKLLNTGFHDQSNENEAKNAMKLAQRLMRKHNLTQALLLKERQEKNAKEQGNGSNDEILKGGSVTVRIVNRKTGKPALFARWLSDMANPLANNFEVKRYHCVTRGRRCNITFYGIYTNAQLAGYAYKVAAERIAQMAAEYTPEKRQRSWWIPDPSTKSARLSYAMGVARGIEKDVNANLRREKERQERKLARDRLASSTGEAYEESDDDDDDKEGMGFSIDNDDTEEDRKPNDDTENDIEPAAKVTVVQSNKEEGDDKNNTTQSHVKQKEKVDHDRRLEELEKEKQAAIVLVDHREKIADEVLKERGINRPREESAKRFPLTVGPITRALRTQKKWISTSERFVMRSRSRRKSDDTTDLTISKVPQDMSAFVSVAILSPKTLESIDDGRLWFLSVGSETKRS